MSVDINALSSALFSRNWLERESALIAIGQALAAEHAGADVYRSLQQAAFQLFIKDPIRLVRLAARNCLQQENIDCELLRREVLAVLHGSEVKQKSRCLELIPMIFRPPSEIDQLFPSLIQDSSAKVRTEAIKAAVCYSDNFVELIEKRKQDGDPRVRATARIAHEQVLSNSGTSSDWRSVPKTWLAID